MSDHDPLCPDPEWPGPTCVYCSVAVKARVDERVRLRDRAATATLRSTDNSLTTLAIDDPHGIGWVPVSTDLIRSLVENRNADTEEIRARERERIAQAWSEKDWPLLTPYVKNGSVIGAAQAVTDWLRAGGRDE